MFWYYDYMFGIMRLNILFGMVGFYIIWLKEKLLVWIFYKNYEVMFFLQDKVLYNDGRINFFIVGLFLRNYFYWCLEYFGDVIFVNGKVWFYFVVKFCKYCFCFVNGGNVRVFEFFLSIYKIGFI